MHILTSVVKKFTEETHYSKICALDNKPSVIIQDESASKTYSRDMLISSISVDDHAQLFETTREKNYSINAPGAHIYFLGL